MKRYFVRLIDDTIIRQLKAIGCIAIEGPKWCGKSTTGERFAKTVIKLQDPIIFKQYLGLASTSRKHLLAGEKPLMFDEWQKIPDIWDFIRMDIDEQNEPGRYILTGSAKPNEDISRHTGTGRIAKIIMRPMSLWESKDSTGEISLRDIFDGKDCIFGKARLSLDDLAFVTCRGGWPQSVAHPKRAQILIEDYFVSLTTEDIVNVDGIRRNSQRAQAILRAYARNIATCATNSSLLADITARDSSMDKATLSSYLLAFKKLFVIENIQAWSPKLRSKSIIRSAEKLHFIDPSLATVALDAKPKDLISDLNTFGFFFESLCIRDLKIYAQMLNGKVHHYHDSDDLEADAIIHLSNGKWGAVEIKLGGNHIDEAANNLLKLKRKVNTEKVSEPCFLMIITGVPNAYRRPDGVLVVPIGCLKD